MQSKLWKMISIFITIPLMIALLLTCAQWRISDLDYFEQEYTKYGVLEDVNMEMNDLLDVTTHMMRYLYDEVEELQIVTTIDGEQTPFFGEKELRHMVDVQQLFAKGILFRNIGIVVCIVVCICSIWKKQYYSFFWGIRSGIILFFGLCAGFIKLMMQDFTKYFTQFHLIFFDNDDWILNPNTDRLINIVPEGFFFDTAISIGITFLVCCIVLFVSLTLVLQHCKQKQELGV